VPAALVLVICAAAGVRCRGPSQPVVPAAGRGAHSRCQLFANAAIAPSRVGALSKIASEMKAPDARLSELLGLSLLATGGCVLALSQDDFLFATIFGTACAVATIEAIRRSR
jgi:hypothetical protein